MRKSNNLKKGLIPLIIFLILLNSVMFVPTIKAQATFDTGFEGGTVTQQFSNSWLATDNISETFYVDSSNTRSGTRDFKISGNSNALGFWNYTYGADSVMTNWGVWFYPDDDPCVTDVYFIDLPSTASPVIHMLVSYQNVRYYDVDGAEHILVSVDTDAYNYFGWEIVANDTVNYFSCNSTNSWSNATDSPRNVLDRPVIDNINWNGDAVGHFNHIWYDDHNITISTDFEGEDTQYGDVSDFSYIGDLNYYSPQFYYYTDKYMEEKRFVKMNCDVKAVDLLVANDLYRENPDLSKYQLKVNNQHVGSADYWIPYNDNYLLRWIDFTVPISDFPVLEFYHSESAYGHYWWGIGGAYSGDDIDNDGETSFRHHSNAYQFNGIYDGSIYSAELIYRMYYTGEYYQPPQTYEDVIDTDKNNYEQFEIVTVAGSVSTILYENKLVIESMGTEYVNKTIHGYTFSDFFTPTIEGIYNATIFRVGTGTVKTCSFTVTIATTEHYIYTVDNPSQPLENFNVYFKYNYTVTPCAIVLFDADNVLNPLKIWRYDTVPVEDSFSYILNNEGVYFFDLCSYYFDNTTHNYIYTTVKRHRHICKNEYPNQLNVVFDVVNFGDAQVVFGSHNFLGANIVVKMNDEVAFSVSQQSEFNQLYIPQYIGEYNATLVLTLSNTVLILDYALFSVPGEIPPEEEEPVMGVPAEYMRAMFGAFITLGFLLLPLGLLKDKATNLIYGIFGGIGLGISTIMGLFPLWLPFMITLIILAIIIVEYKKG